MDLSSEERKRCALPNFMSLCGTGAGKEERLCWEFKCEDGEGKHVIVYADASTGEEVKLLLLLEDENGTLVL